MSDGSRSCHEHFYSKSLEGTLEPDLSCAPARKNGVTLNYATPLVRNGFAVAWLDETRRARYLGQMQSYVEGAVAGA